MEGKIAIIDQGVDRRHRALRSARIDGISIGRQARGVFTCVDGQFDDRDGHGTAIAAIIHQLHPAAELFAVKLNHGGDDAMLTEDLLIEGIRCCARRAEIRIINISLGLTLFEPSPELFLACREAEEAGKIIVASAYNRGGIDCYPACFQSVYGVSTGIGIEKEDYAWLGPGAINILARGTEQEVAWLHDSYRTTSGTSYATAHFSGILGRLLAVAGNKVAGPEDVRRLIAAHAKPGIPPLYYIRNKSTPISPETIESAARQIFDTAGNLHFARRIALFPASDKEIRTILEFPSACPLEIAFVIDPPGENTSHPTLPLTPGQYDAFDTLAAGYFLDQYTDAAILAGLELIKACIARNKHFILWDHDAHDRLLHLIREHQDSGGDYTGQIYFPAIGAKDAAIAAELRHLPKFDTPVLATIGTGGMQGKITTQLLMRRLLTGMGYRVAHFSTEPHAALLGAASVFPYGYKSIVGLGKDDWIRYLGQCLKAIQHYHSPDIILTGTQGGTIPRLQSDADFQDNVLSSLQFLTGVHPDALICTINPMDSIELIRHTLYTVYSFCRVRPIFFVMTPWSRVYRQPKDDRRTDGYTILSPEECRARREEFSAELGLPVFDIHDRGCHAEMAHLVQRHFSSNQTRLS